MNEPSMDDLKVQLRRLVEALDEVPPTDEEAHALCEAMGIDIEAVRARILAAGRRPRGGGDRGGGGPAEPPARAEHAGRRRRPGGRRAAPRPGRQRKSDPHGRRAR